MRTLRQRAGLSIWDSVQGSCQWDKVCRSKISDDSQSQTLLPNPLPEPSLNSDETTPGSSRHFPLVICPVIKTFLHLLLWWLILSQLDWPWDVQIKHYVWVCLWRCFQIRLAIGGLTKVDCPPQYEWALSNPLRTWIEQKAEEGGTCLFFPASLLNWSITSHLVFSGLRLRFTQFVPLVLRLLDLDWTTPLAFLCLHVARLCMANHGTSQPLWLCEPILHNNNNLLLYIYVKVYIYICFCFCFSGEP